MINLNVQVYIGKIAWECIMHNSWRIGTLVPNSNRPVIKNCGAEDEITSD